MIKASDIHLEDISSLLVETAAQFSVTTKKFCEVFDIN